MSTNVTMSVEKYDLLRAIANAATDLVTYGAPAYDDLCEAVVAGQDYLIAHPEDRDIYE